MGTRDGFCGLEEPLASACAPLGGDSISQVLRDIGALVLEAEKGLFLAEQGPSWCSCSAALQCLVLRAATMRGQLFLLFKYFWMLLCVFVHGDMSTDCKEAGAAEIKIFLELTRCVPNQRLPSWCWKQTGITLKPGSSQFGSLRRTGWCSCGCLLGRKRTV